MRRPTRCARSLLEFRVAHGHPQDIVPAYLTTRKRPGGVNAAQTHFSVKAATRRHYPFQMVLDDVRVRSDD